jgi:hypothetical protein
VIRGHVETTSRSFAGVTDILRESSNELKTVPNRIDAMAGTIADGTRQGVTKGMDQVADHIGKKLENVVLILERSAGALSKSFSEPSPRDADGVVVSLDLARSIRQAAEEMRKACEESRRLAVALQQMQPARGEDNSKKGDGPFWRFWGR